MSQGWLRKGDVFEKLLPIGTSNVFKRSCYWPFSQLANINQYEDDSRSFCRITSEAEFLKFQQAMLGREVGLSELGMITPAQFSLPLLLFYEVHDDEASRETILSLLPFLAKMGYSHFCLEEDHDASAEEITDKLMYSTSRTLNVLNKQKKEEPLTSIEAQVLPQAVRLLPAEMSLLLIMQTLRKLNIKYRGIDDHYGNHRWSGGMSEDEALASLSKRDPRIAKRLTDTAKASGGGTVALMGAAHESGVHANAQKMLTGVDVQNTLTFHVHSADRNPVDFPQSRRVNFFSLAINNKEKAIDEIKKTIENKLKILKY